MSDYEKENKFHFLVADLYAIMQDVFHTAEAQTFDDEDYYWWAEHFTLRIIKHFKEGEEIIKVVDKEGGER